MTHALLLVALITTQQHRTAPLRKSDLVRLLSAAELSAGELAQLVRPNRLTFDATSRDRNDLQLMGADGTLLAAGDGRARRQAPRRGGNPPPTAGPPPATAPPAPPGQLSPSR